VANPIFFEDPVIHSEISPIFAYHRIDHGSSQALAKPSSTRCSCAGRSRTAWPSSPRQDGYFNIDLDNGASLDGWMDLAAGFKYAVIDDVENQFILTPRSAPSTSATEAMTKSSKAEANRANGIAFVSAAKGFDQSPPHHRCRSAILPNDTDGARAPSLHYSLMAELPRLPEVHPLRGRQRLAPSRRTATASAARLGRL